MFVCLVRLMHQDQSLLPAYYASLGLYSLIFTHWMHPKTENSQVQSSLLKVIHDNKRMATYALKAPESLDLLSEKSLSLADTSIQL